MKKSDKYMHFKNNSYEFIGIAIPKVDISLHHTLQTDMEITEYVRFHDNSYEIALYGYKGVMFIESTIPHVIYEDEKTHTRWARPVDDFFGYKELEDGQLVKRFTKQETD